MSFEPLGLIVLFVGLLVLPFLPGLMELRRPRDDAPLPIDQSYTRNPRFFGLSFRRKLAQFLEGVRPPFPVVREIQLRRMERLEIHRDFVLPAGTRSGAVLVALGRLEVERDGELGDAYARGATRLGPGGRVRGLACDDALRLEGECRVERWLDAEGDISVGLRCDLGLSASTARSLRLAEGCRFKRLWGLPVLTDTVPGGRPEAPPASREAEPEASAEATVDGRPRRREGEPDRALTIEDVVVRRWRDFHVHAGTVIEGDVVGSSEIRIGAGSIVRGTIKAYGAIHLAEGVQIKGSLISRNEIRIAGGARIDGHVFAEGDVVVGPGTQIGEPGRFKSLYSAGAVRLSPGIQIFGWVIAEHGGSVG